MCTRASHKRSHKKVHKTIKRLILLFRTNMPPKRRNTRRTAGSRPAKKQRTRKEHDQQQAARRTARERREELLKSSESESEPEPEAGAAAAAAAAKSSESESESDATQWRAVIYGRTTTMIRMMLEMQNQHRHDMAELKRRIRTLESNNRILLHRPVVSIVGGIHSQTPTSQIPVGQPASVNTNGPATLSKGPENLSILWNEYQNGLDGAKPAKDFTASERGGRNKANYCRRKPFWKCMNRLVSAGNDPAESIRRIHEVYGWLSVTNILKAMRPDEKEGQNGHHRLRS